MCGVQFLVYYAAYSRVASIHISALKLHKAESNYDELCTELTKWKTFSLKAVNDIFAATVPFN